MNKDIRSFVSQNNKLLYCHSGHSDTFMGGRYGHKINYVRRGVGGPRTPHLP